MLPTYCPDEKLGQALSAVLAQAAPAAEMQIAVVDDGSPPGLVEELVRSVDRDGRVEIVRPGERLGLAGNWNRAIALARGQFVHLLHQDDYVLPGFYARLEHGFRRLPGAGMAFCRTQLVDGDDRFLKSSSRLRWFAGPLQNWLRVIACRQRLQTPAVVVPRATYEQLGGYRTDLCQALDWEMWVRIAAAYSVWYEPRCLAVYRRHPGNESTRLFQSGAVWPDVLRAIELNAECLPESCRAMTEASARWHAASALRTAERLVAHGAIDHAATTVMHVPAFMRLITADSPANIIQRRLAALQARLSRSSRRAA